MDENNELVNIFMREGLTKSEVAGLVHDEDEWYMVNDDGDSFWSLCVGYGEKNEKCNRSEHYCCGGRTFGSWEMQAKAVKNALYNTDKTHPSCPLIV